MDTEQLVYIAYYSYITSYGPPPETPIFRTILDYRVTARDPLSVVVPASDFAPVLLKKPPSIDIGETAQPHTIVNLAH